MHKAVETLVSAALAEDIGQEDLTTNTVVSPDLRCRARLYAIRGRQTPAAGLQPLAQIGERPGAHAG